MCRYYSKHKKIEDKANNQVHQEEIEVGKILDICRKKQLKKNNIFDKLLLRILYKNNVIYREKNYEYDRKHKTSIYRNR